MNSFQTIAIPHKDILERRLTLDTFAADLWDLTQLIIRYLFIFVKVEGSGKQGCVKVEFLKSGRPQRRLSQNPKKGLNAGFGRIQDSPLQRVSGLR